MALWPVIRLLERSRARLELQTRLLPQPPRIAQGWRFSHRSFKILLYGLYAPGLKKKKKLEYTFPFHTAEHISAYFLHCAFLPDVKLHPIRAQSPSLLSRLHWVEFPECLSFILLSWTLQGLSSLSLLRRTPGSSPYAEGSGPGWEQDGGPEGTCSFHLGLYCQKTLRRDCTGSLPTPRLAPHPNWPGRCNTPRPHLLRA